jgi:SOS response regulatory protein OraA/RecX
MRIQLNAAARLVEVSAAVPNKIKNEVMRTLTSKGFTVDRQGDDAFIVHEPKEKVIETLEAAGWEYDNAYAELTRDEGEWSLALKSSASATKLEFLWEG